MDKEIERVMRTYANQLSRSDKELLYAALQLGKKHADAFGEAVRLRPMHAVLISVLLEQERQLQLLSKGEQ